MPLVQWGAVTCTSLVAAVWDVARRRIPNLLTGPAFVAGLVFAVLIAGLSGLADALLGSLLMAAPCGVLLLYAGGGGGDVKLMGAIGAWLGVVNGTIALFAVSLAGVLLAIGFVIARRKKIGNADDLADNSYEAESGRTKDAAVVEANEARRKPGKTMPYGLAIFFGVLIAAVGVLIWRL